jgi:hypothetical protein
MGCLEFAFASLLFQLWFIEIELRVSLVSSFLMSSDYSLVPLTMLSLDCHPSLVFGEEL